MTTSIKTWQIVDGQLREVQTSLVTEGRTEQLDLETWIASDPSVLGPDLVIIGRQVATKSGSLDLLAISRLGEIVIVELKRDKLPREALVQAIDYASDVATWGVEKVGEVCVKYTGRELEEVLAEAFPDVDLEAMNINEAQRIVLVGFSVEAALERMISWLSTAYGMAVNAVILHYTRTSGGDELLTRTAIISEELEQERVQKRKFRIPMSDDPGEHPEDELRDLLISYLSQDARTMKLMREVIIPMLLDQGVVSRSNLLEAFVDGGYSETLIAAGYTFTSISRQIGMAKNDFLRQVIGYEYPNYPWEKDNFSIRPDYRQLLAQVITAIREHEDKKPN